MLQHRQGGAQKLYGGYVGGNVREIGINLDISFQKPA